MSDVIPDVVHHPVLLDVAVKETMMRTGEPMSPLHFRGFRLHTIWTQQSGGDLVCQVTFPHFLGQSTSSMLEYEPEKFPHGLMQGPKMVINLRPPSSDHWNIITDLVLPLAVGTFRQQREAKWMAPGLGEGSLGAKVLPMEAPAPRESPEVVAGSNRAALPTETTNQGEEASETAHEILERVHAIRLQTMHEMGSVRELDWTVARTLMAEFVRLQQIIGEDLNKSLVALHADLETSCEALSSDFARTF